MTGGGHLSECACTSVSLPITITTTPLHATRPDKESREEWTKGLHARNDIMGYPQCLVHCPNTSEKSECFCLMYAQRYDQLPKHILQIKTLLSSTTDRA